MLKILKNKHLIEVEFDGIKIFNCSNPTKLYRDLILDSEIFIDNYRFKNENVIYINNFTSLWEFVNLNKKSFLINKINEYIFEHNLINYDNVQKISEKINSEFNYPIIDMCEGDNNKIVNLLFELSNNEYLNQNSLTMILNNIFDEKKLIIFDNIEWIDLKFLNKFINQHNFIIITNDFVNFIENSNELELLTIFKQNLLYTDIIDTQHSCFYLENKLNKVVSDNNIIDILKSNSLDSVILKWLINEI